MNNYLKITKPYREQSLLALKQFITIPSVYDESTVTKETPFGKNVDDALKFVADLGSRFGFEVDRCDGYCTELSYGKGDNLIMIFAHADVVPATGAWNTDPFTPTVVKHKLVGRGSTDDKGPLIASFYAVKALKDNGLIDDYRVKIVVGGDEERGSGCLKYYYENLHKEEPTYGFTPDSDFPLIYGEKGIINFDIKKDIHGLDDISLSGGLVYNAVMDECTLKGKISEDFISYLNKEKIDFKKSDDAIVFIGQSAHGSTPEKGKNAAIVALNALSEFYNNEDLKKVYSIVSDLNGKTFDGFSSSKELLETTYCLGKISLENGKLTLGINLRYPETSDSETLIKNYANKIEGEYVAYEDSKPLLFDKNSKMIKTMLKAYRAESGDRSEPFTIGGGTYAKHAKNTVAFGAMFQGTDYLIHSPNEFININDFYMMQVIYARAIYMLGKLRED